MEKHFRLVALLEQMKTSCVNAINFSSNVAQQDFLSDIMRQHACGMALIQIGEIASRIQNKFPDFTEENFSWPWKEMKAMRNLIAHAYDSTDQEIVWDTLYKEIPSLLRLIEKALSE